jgi:hypothetical protein
MNRTKIEFRFRQGFIMAVLFSALTVLGVTNLVAAPPSDERRETTPLPIGTEMALKGEVVMIEGNVEIIDDPSAGKKDAYLIMENLFVAQTAGDEAIQFHVNAMTQVDDDLQIGDKVEVLAAENGEALSIKKME